MKVCVGQENIEYRTLFVSTELKKGLFDFARDSSIYFSLDRVHILDF